MLCLRWSLPLILLGTGALPARAEIPLIELDGVVHPVTAAYVVREIDRAERDGAPLVILRINTPGGLMSSMYQIIDKILASRTPVAVFVGPSGARAASAGFVIAISADIVAMAPGTNMGAAHPVSAMGEMDEVMSKKAASDAAAYVRSKAERRGRNSWVAEKAVLESRSFTEREAFDEGLVDVVAKDADELVRALEGRTVCRFDRTEVTLRLGGQRAVARAMSWRESVLSVIATPETLFLLLLGALAGLGTEISHPGLIFPGIIGTVCLVLFLFASQVLPVSAAGVLLILLAIGLFIAEVKVTSYGLLTVGGIVAMILGAMMLVDAPAGELQVPLSLVIPAALAMAAWSITIVSLVLKAQQGPRVTGAEGMIGLPARAETDLAPEGWVVVRGERWQAVSTVTMKAGEEVVVTSVAGLMLHVRPRDREPTAEK